MIIALYAVAGETVYGCMYAFFYSFYVHVPFIYIIRVVIHFDPAVMMLRCDKWG